MQGSLHWKAGVLHFIKMTQILVQLVNSEVKSWCVHKRYHNQMFVGREWSKITDNAGETSKYFIQFHYWLALVQPGYAEGNEFSQRTMA
jgi:predicted ATPase